MTQFIYTVWMKSGNEWLDVWDGYSYDDAKAHVKGVCEVRAAEWFMDYDCHGWTYQELEYRIDCEDVKGVEVCVDLDDYRCDEDLSEHLQDHYAYKYNEWAYI